MSDPIKAFMQSSGLESPAFEPGSRYAGLPTAHAELPDGRTVAYVRRRLIPAPDRFATLSMYEVKAGDRLDNIAAAALGDPQQYWRVCDGNGAMRPAELTETVGLRLRLTLPEGVPEPPDE